MDGVDHPLALGADLTACSAHKTLPVLTGGAFLNIGDTPLAKRDRYSERAKEAMALFGSTSPKLYDHGHRWSRPPIGHSGKANLRFKNW